jgi:hypothetical protein
MVSCSGSIFAKEKANPNASGCKKCGEEATILVEGKCPEC